MALANLNVSLGLFTKNFEQGLKKADRALRSFQRDIEGIGQGLTTSLTLPLVGFGAAAVKSFSDLERGTKALQAVTKDASTVGAQLEQLREVAKLPGLGFEEAVQGSARLQAVGLSADEAARTLGAFGNAVARSGGGRAELDGAVVALTQIASKGKISAEEINQLNERIFEIRPALEAAFGTSNSEELQKLGITSEEFIAKVTDELSKLERVQGGLANSFENLGDSVRSNLARVGQIINDTFDIGDVIDRFDRAITSVVDTFQRLPAETQRIIVSIAAFAASLGPALFALSKLIALRRGVIQTLLLLNDSFKSLAGSAIGAFNNIKKLNFRAILSPQLLAISAAIGVAALAWGEFKTRIDAANAGVKAVREINQQANATVSQQTGEITRLVTQIQNENTSREEKIRLINQLKQANPEYFAQLDAENEGIEAVTKAYEKYIDQLVKTEQLKLVSERLAKVNLEIANFSDNIEEAAKPGAFDILKSVVFGGGSGFQFGAELAGSIQDNVAIAQLALTNEKDSLTKLLNDLAADLNTSGNAAGNATGGIFDRADNAGKKLQKTINDIRNDLSATTQKESLLGASFNEDSERLKILKKGIEDLTEQGVKAGNSFLDGLVAEFNRLKGDTTLLEFDTKLLTAEVDLQIAKDFGNVKPFEVPGITEADSALLAYQNRLREATEQSNIFGATSGDLLSEKLNITKNALQNAVEQFGVNSEVVAQLREQYVLLNEQVLISTEQQRLQNEQLERVSSIVSNLTAPLNEFFTALADGSRNAFQTFVSGFKNAIRELLKQLAVALARALIVATVLSIIFPGSTAAAGGFGKVFSGAFKGFAGLAEGGVVPSGFPNDSYPALLSSGEVVVPPDKLDSIGSSNVQVFIPDLVVRGEDLVIAFNRAQNKYNRFS